MSWAVTFMREENGTVDVDTFTAENEKEARAAFRACYRHGNYRILSAVEVPVQYIKQKSTG